MFIIFKDFDFNKAKQWTQVSSLFDKTGETKNKRYIDEISEILIDLSGKKKVMEISGSLKKFYPRKMNTNICIRNCQCT